MISAINNQGKLHFLLYSDAINSDRLISFMEAIIKSNDGRKVYLILDNLRVHHSKAVSEWTDTHKEEIRLFYLTPYSPEYNPDEYLNNDLKRNLGTQAMVKSVEELETNTQEFMSKLSDDPDRVQSYFDHPALDNYKFD
jgi:transposase